MNSPELPLDAGEISVTLARLRVPQPSQCFAAREV